MSNQTSEAVKAFVKIARKWKRTYDSRNYQYWERHEEETAAGWDFARRYPYRKAAEQAAERADMLHDQAVEVYENASPEDRRAIEEADQWFLVTC